VTGRHRDPKRKLRAGWRAPTLKRTSLSRQYNASHFAISFHRRVWHRALSLRYACIRSFGIILTTFVPNSVSFAASIAELAPGKIAYTQLTSQSPSLFDVPGTEAFASEKLFLYETQI